MATREELERRSADDRRAREEAARRAAEEASAREASDGTYYTSPYGGRETGLNYGDSFGRGGVGFHRGVNQLVREDQLRRQGDAWRSGYLDSDPTFTPDYAYENTIDAGSSAFEGAGAESIEAQRRALGMLQTQAETQGFTPAERSMQQSVMRQAEQSSRGQRMADLQALEARGMGGSGMSMVAGQMAGQAGADRAADFGAQAMMAAQQRALAAMSQYGQAASQMRGQDYQRAGALDSWNQALAERAQAVEGRNTERYNQSQDQGYANRFQREALNQNSAGMASQEAENERNRAFTERTGREARTDALIGGVIGNISGGVRGMGG